MSEESKKSVNRENKMLNDQEDTTVDSDVYEIDLVEQVKTLWRGRKTILLITAIFTGIGLFHYLFGPVEYESESILIQETEGGGGDLSGNAILQSLAGGAFGTGSAVTATARGYAPPPLFLYPSIVHSTGFQQELIHRPVEFTTLGEELTLFQYFQEYHQPPVRNRVYTFIGDYTIKLPITILRGVRNLFRRTNSDDSDESSEDMNNVEETDDRLLAIPNSEMGVINNLRTRITLNIGNGLTTVRTRLPDPKAAALINAYLVEHIQEYMTDYRLEKARQNLSFVQDQYEDARDRYEEARLELAEFQDSNLNIQSAVARTREADLQDQRDLAFSIYNSITREVEQARLTLQQQTPVFNILEKSNIPNSPYTGASNLLLVFSIVLGLFTGIIWVVSRNLYQWYRTGR